MIFRFKYNIQFILFVALSHVLLFGQSSWQSQVVYFGNDGKLVYTLDGEKNRIPDFSFAGYKNGEQPIPFVDVVKTISPIAGDNTANIQSAIDEAGKKSLLNGIRGTVLLNPGRYEVKGKIKINYSGVVLRGMGDGEDSTTNTIIVATGDSATQTSVIIAGGGSSRLWRDSVLATRTNILSDTVFVGTNFFDVENVSHYQVGDNIIIYQPCTDAWLQSINYGGTHGGPAWSTDPSSEAFFPPIVYNRWIKAISGNRITIDVPVYNHLIRKLSQTYIYKYSRSGLLTNIGLENLRVDIQTNGDPLDEHHHAWQAIDLYQIEDSWVKNCTMLHFGQSGIRSNTATRITIENCKALDPVSIITGERRYNFNMYTASQQILVKNCHASHGRHHYVSNGTTLTSGIVFTNCTSSGAYTSSEGHRWWSQGMLYDNHTEIDNAHISSSGVDSRILGLYNRGNYGTSHGWATATCVAWNCNIGTKAIMVIQKPPTAQNYAIGCFGRKITGLTSEGAPFNEPQGYIEGANVSGVNPPSLYLAQLEERMKATDIKTNSNEHDINFQLKQNYPNPFNPTTTLEYSVSSSQNVTLKVYNILGKEVAVLVNEVKQQGSYIVDFSAANLASGTYLYSLQAGNFTSNKKMILLK